MEKLLLKNKVHTLPPVFPDDIRAVKMNILELLYLSTTFSKSLQT
jgi:hypothetical protein